MPRAASVPQTEAVQAIVDSGGKELIELNGILPRYSSLFYKDISKALNYKWSSQVVYTNLRENRNFLRTEVFSILKILETKNENELKEISEENQLDDNFLDISRESTSSTEVSDLNLSEIEYSFSRNNNIVHLIISSKQYEEFKPVLKTYKKRDTLVLEPEAWTDTISDEFWRQFRLPCAYSFKSATVSENPDTNFLTIKGYCKSRVCGNLFLGIARNEPLSGQDLIIEVDTRDTSKEEHEIVKRQLKYKKRKYVGDNLLTEGASNYRRKIAREEMRVGDVEAPILYEGTVLRKLKQEASDKNLGLHPEDGKNPVLTLQKLKHTPPYVGSIGIIGLDEFFMHYILPEQIHVMKEYCRQNQNSSISIDSTGSLAKKLKINEHKLSGHIFLTEIVINFQKQTVPVGQMLSVLQDTTSYEFFLLRWLKTGCPKPKEAVADYSKAILGALSFIFNGLTLKEYVSKCFMILQKNSNERPASTFIRVDVAHLIAIFSRLPCFKKSNWSVKDFLLRCVALLVTCSNFKKFENILILILTVTSHNCSGNSEENNESFIYPAKIARQTLAEYIRKEKHVFDKLLSEKENKEYERFLLKMNADPSKEHSLINEPTNSDEKIKLWIRNLEQQVEAGNVKGTVANAYYLPKFKKHLVKLAHEFPLWTGVMTSNFHSKIIRATSAYCEGEFNELKTRILKKHTSPLRLDKLFVEHWRALKGAALIGSGKLTVNQMKVNNEEKENSASRDQNVQSLKTNFCTPDEKNNINSSTDQTIEASDTNFSIPHSKDRNNDPENQAFESSIINVSTNGTEGNNAFTEQIMKPLKTNFSTPHSKEINCASADQTFESSITNISTNTTNGNNAFTEQIIESLKTNVSTPYSKDINNASANQTFESPIINFSPSKEIPINLVGKDESYEQVVKVLPILDVYELNEKENWRQKGDKENPLLTKEISTIVAKKRSKYFNPCPEIIFENHRTVSFAKKNKKKIKLFLDNGNKFLTALKINGTSIMMKNTCTFDSITSIMATTAIDNENYLEHITESSNETLHFVFKFLHEGATAATYSQRCIILKDFINSANHQKDDKLFKSKSPKHLRIIDVYCNIVIMWKYLTIGEPSAIRYKTCICGNKEVDELSVLNVNENIIKTQGFRALEKSVILKENIKQCNFCNQSVKENISLNMHLFIELDIRIRLNSEISTLTCKASDFPDIITVKQERFRLAGIIIYFPNHYVALSRRITAHWEVYNDLSAKKSSHNPKTVISPHAVIYTKV